MKKSIKKVSGILGVLIGAAGITYGVSLWQHFKMQRDMVASTENIIGGADGPTSIFLAERTNYFGIYGVAILGLVGCYCVLKFIKIRYKK